MVYKRKPSQPNVNGVATETQNDEFNNGWDHSSDGADRNKANPVKTEPDRFNQKQTGDAFKFLNLTNENGISCQKYLMTLSDLKSNVRYEELSAYQNFVINPSKAGLEQQAAVFAANMMIEGADAYKVLGRRKTVDQIQLYSEIFMYSYIKVIYAIKANKEKGAYLKSPVFRGHGYLYRMCIEGGTIYTEGNSPSFHRQIVVTTENIDKIIKIFDNYLIGKVAKDSLGMDGNVIIPFMENVLNRASLGYFRLKGDSQLMVLSNSDTFVHSTLLDPATNPLGNCFLNPTGDQLYVPINNKTNVKDFSFIINKSNFITFESYSDSFTDDNLSPPKFMIPLYIGVSDNLILDEVKFITGVNCSIALNRRYEEHYYPRPSNNLSNPLNKEDFGSNPNYFQRTKTTPIQGEQPSKQ
jgi:hypothetical protein